MVNVFGDNTFAGFKTGKRGLPRKPGSKFPPGKHGKQGKRGEQGENNGLFSQFLHFWIDGYDIKLKPFKLSNKYNHQNDGDCFDLEKPKMGIDLVSGRQTQELDGKKDIICPFNWNPIVNIDCLQVFIVFKYSYIEGTDINNGLFGPDNGGWDRLVALKDNTLIIGGVVSSITLEDTRNMTIASFPIDANPLQT